MSKRRRAKKARDASAIAIPLVQVLKRGQAIGDICGEKDTRAFRSPAGN